MHAIVLYTFTESPIENSPSIFFPKYNFYRKHQNKSTHLSNLFKPNNMPPLCSVTTHAQFPLFKLHWYLEPYKKTSRLFLCKNGVQCQERVASATWIFNKRHPGQNISHRSFAKSWGNWMCAQQKAGDRTSGKKWK